SWDERAPLHAASPDYGLDRFRSDPDYLSDVVAFDLPRLGSIEGLRVLHLQCHIGTDTVSLARLGASRVTGLDFSPASLAVARDLAADLGLPLDFVQTNAYQAAEVLGHGVFDLVYTGIGALCWLPSIERWAQVVSDLLAPGGRLFLREGHPVLWSLAYQATDRLVIAHPYFETVDPIVDDEDETYVRTDSRLQNTVTHSWNHALAEVISALQGAGLEFTSLAEHTSVPWSAIPELMEEIGHGEFALRERPERLPMSYTLQARKP
ncbi:MAG: class I SAM-dependent methyltransferase, partial [Actinomycetales bacterium]